MTKAPVNAACEPLNSPTTSTFMCATEAYAMIFFRSTWRMVVRDAYTTPQEASVRTNGQTACDASGQIEIAKRSMP